MTGNNQNDHGVGSDPAEDLADRYPLTFLAAVGAPTDWRSLPAADRGQSWSGLREWVEWFRCEFVLDHRTVPPCWYRHSAVVSVLSALHDHWRYAYDPLNSLLGPSDWHRTFMQLEQRLRDWASRTGCTAGAHRDDVVAGYPNDEVEWTAHVAADVARHAETGLAVGR